MRRAISIVLLLVLSFLLGYDHALTRLADDMHFGRTSLRDNRLVMEIKHRRVLWRNRW